MRRVIVVLVMAAALIGSGSVPSGARTIAHECTSTGTLLYTANPDTSVSYVVGGRGTCSRQGIPTENLQTVQFTGAGSARPIGPCPTWVALQDLIINVTATYTDVVTGRTNTEQQVWSIPLTPFPIASPFVAFSDAGTIGAGVLFTHIFDQCGNDGSKPSTRFDWILA